ncbi:amidohydrolase family protein [Flavitalea flava]
MKYIIFFLALFYHNCFSQVSLKDVALTGVTIIDANHKGSLQHQTVILKGSTIIQIIPDGSKPLPDSMSIIKLTGKYLIPGLIDTHVHLATDPSGKDNRAATLDVLNRMLYSGITSVRDMAGDARTLASLSRDALTGDIISPNIYYSALMAGPDFFNDPRTSSSTRGAVSGQMPYMKAVTDSTNLILAIAEAKGTGATGIKLYADLSEELAAKIVCEATRQGIMVWGHAWLNPAKPTGMVRAGLSSISHAPLLIYDLKDSIPSVWKKNLHKAGFWDTVILYNLPVFRLMKDHHTILDATLLTYKKWGEQDSMHRFSYEIGKRFTAAAYKRGIIISAGTDDDQEEFVQKEMILLVQDAGFTPIDALIAATQNGAMALGLDQHCGTIDINKTADLVVLDKNPLENINNILSIYMVIKAGKIFRL